MPFDKARNNTPIKNARQLFNNRYFECITKILQGSLPPACILQLPG